MPRTPLASTQFLGSHSSLIRAESDTSWRFPSYSERLLLSAAVDLEAGSLYKEARLRDRYAYKIIVPAVVLVALKLKESWNRGFRHGYPLVSDMHYGRERQDMRNLQPYRAQRSRYQDRVPGIAATTGMISELRHVRSHSDSSAQSSEAGGNKQHAR